MSAAGDDKAREEVRRWLVAADEDVASARVLIAATPPRTATAAYLCQQAAEKLMKGLLTCAAVPFRKTHNLDELAGQVSDTFTELRGGAASLRWQTSWNFVIRYPAAENPPEPVPGVAEIEAVLADIGRLRAELDDRAAGSGRLGRHGDPQPWPHRADAGRAARGARPRGCRRAGWDLRGETWPALSRRGSRGLTFRRVRDVAEPPLNGISGSGSASVPSRKSKSQPSADELQRPPDRGLRRDVQDARGVGGAAHPRVGDPQHVAHAPLQQPGRQRQHVPFGMPAATAPAFLSTSTWLGVTSRSSRPISAARWS
jgi:HEPN domain-containing protein